MEEIHKVSSVPYSPLPQKKDTEKRLMCLKTWLKRERVNLFLTVNLGASNRLCVILVDLHLRCKSVAMAFYFGVAILSLLCCDILVPTGKSSRNFSPHKLGLRM